MLQQLSPMLRVLLLIAGVGLVSAPVVRAAALMSAETDGGTVVSETGGTDTFTFRLDAPPMSDVTVQVIPANGAEVKVSPASLVFTSTNWSTPQVITATGVDDDAADGNQFTTIRLEASSSDPSFNGLRSTVNVLTMDDESTTLMLIEHGGATMVSEQGTTDEFDVVLPSRPSADVTVSIRSANPGEVIVSQPSGLIFTRDNWNTSQRVTLQGADDTAADGNTVTPVTITFTSADPAFNNMFLTLNVTNMDNEAAASPTRPTIIGPSHGGKLAGMSTMVTWENPPGTTQYQIQVVPFNSDGPGINLIRNAETSYVIEDPDLGADQPNYVLLPDMTYTVRIRTTASTGGTGDLTDADWSNWSEARLFETANATSDTILLESPSGTNGVPSLLPVLQWSNGNDDVYYYEIQASKDPAFGNGSFLYWELRHGGMSTPLNSYRIPDAYPLEANATYHWRVRPRIQGDGTPVPWSAAASFATAADATMDHEAPVGGGRGSVPAAGVVRASVSNPSR